MKSESKRETGIDVRIVYSIGTSTVPVISDHVDRESRAFQVVSPSFEGFKNRKELFVVDVIVEFRSGKGLGVEQMGCSLPFDVVIERTAASA